MSFPKKPWENAANTARPAPAASTTSSSIAASSATRAMAATTASRTTGTAITTPGQGSVADTSDAASANAMNGAYGGNNYAGRYGAGGYGSAMGGYGGGYGSGMGMSGYGGYGSSYGGYGGYGSSMYGGGMYGGGMYGGGMYGGNPMMDPNGSLGWLNSFNQTVSAVGQITQLLGMNAEALNFCFGNFVHFMERMAFMCTSAVAMLSPKPVFPPGHPRYGEPPETEEEIKSRLRRVKVVKFVVSLLIIYVASKLGQKLRMLLWRTRKSPQKRLPLDSIYNRIAQPQ
ncbi:hypothetical protein ACHHYP_04497 [Achlya hypogyna]|uniref:Peroxin-13 n=1 Tax=Achlya hypogyna TaxID=1202772 RepID=A0A1V9Z127_ACHHY|nr:hypothetical protein ACHHYP_04497 [Achlya hypogyna]